MASILKISQLAATSSMITNYLQSGYLKHVKLWVRPVICYKTGMIENHSQHTGWSWTILVKIYYWRSSGRHVAFMCLPKRFSNPHLIRLHLLADQINSLIALGSLKLINIAPRVVVHTFFFIARSSSSNSIIFLRNASRELQDWHRPYRIPLKCSRWYGVLVHHFSRLVIFEV